MLEVTNAYKILVGEFEEETLLGRHWRIWKYLNVRKSFG